MNICVNVKGGILLMSLLNLYHFIRLKYFLIVGLNNSLFNYLKVDFMKN